MASSLAYAADHELSHFYSLATKIITTSYLISNATKRLVASRTGTAKPADFFDEKCIETLDHTN